MVRVLLAKEFVLVPRRMTVLAWLALFLSWGSLGLETATIVVSRSSKTVMGTWARTERRVWSGEGLGE